MATRSAQAVWNGDLKNGKGVMKLGSGAFEGSYSFASRFEDGKGTNPEELVGAAHAGCFSMALSAMLADAGFTPESVETSAKVTFEKVADGFGITKIALDTSARIPGIDNDTFQKFAGDAKKGCPVSKALASVPEITLNAKLV
ncbi:MAG TPA: OsmC family protein [Armatimonadota bacterium]|jgi:osmotically inducible protein OsmC